MVKCQSCGGIYEPVLSDGMQYFHACPPLSAPELQAAVDAGAVTLPKGETVEEAVLLRTYERANKRDENVVAGSDPDKDAPIKAEGDGAVEVDAIALPPSVVVPRRGV